MSAENPPQPNDEGPMRDFRQKLGKRLEDMATDASIYEPAERIGPPTKEEYEAMLAHFATKHASQPEPEPDTHPDHIAMQNEDESYKATVEDELRRVWDEKAKRT